MTNTTATAERVWSKQQEAIFDWFAKGTGSLTVRARAGTAKTTSLLEGIDRAPEARILCCAFNKKIADELQARIHNPRAEAKTMHSLGFGLIMRNWSGVQVDKKGERPFALAQRATDGRAADQIVALVGRLCEMAKQVVPFAKTWNELIAVAREYDLEPEADWDDDLEPCGCRCPDAAQDQSCTKCGHEGYQGVVCGEQVQKYTTSKICQWAHKAMELSKEKTAVITFTDMLWLPLVHGWVQAKYDLVVIDELQDLNAAQVELACRSCRPGGRLVGLGDDRQGIYAGRGAVADVLDVVKDRWKAHELPLTITWRCPKAVVAMAKRIVPDYEAAPQAPEGQVIDLPLDKALELTVPGDFVVSRLNAPLVRVCLSILRRGVRANIEGRDVGAGLVALVRKLKGRSMVDFLQKLQKWEERETNRARASKNERKEAEVHDKAMTLEFLAEGLSGVSELEARICSLFTDDDHGRAGRVTCSSVHRIKGLEADRVFVLRDTMYPGKKGHAKIEEQNIDYVAITRAKKVLYQVHGLPGKA